MNVISLIAGGEPDVEDLPGEVMRLLNIRLWISIAGVFSLITVFAILIYSPQIVRVAKWFG